MVWTHLRLLRAAAWVLGGQNGQNERRFSVFFHGQPVEEEEELKERRCSDQPVLVSYGAVQESHLIVA